MPHRLAVHSRRGAYVALVFLTLIWGSNWVIMKLALQSASPVILNVQRQPGANLIQVAERVKALRNGEIVFSEAAAAGSVAVNAR